MNIDTWKKRSFTTEYPIHYSCPSCYAGILNPKKKIEISITPSGKDMDYYGYDKIEHLFHGILICNNCSEIISVNGLCLRERAYIKDQESGEISEGIVSIFYPKFFFPNLKMFPIDSEVATESVIEQINLSFSHYFHDLSSCANRIRNSIELILDDLKAAKRKKNKKGLLGTFANLHQRIEHFQRKNKQIGNLLLAIKIIGNQGSHVGEVTVNDILDAYQILEQLIEITYIKSNKKVAQIAKEIVIKNKPRSK